MKFWTRKSSHVPTSDEFTDHVLRKLRKNAPSLSASIQGDLQLRVEIGSGRLVVHLDRFYAKLAASPREQTEIVQEAVRGAIALATDQATQPLLSCLMPVIKSKEWRDSVREQVHQEGADEIALMTDDLNDDLVIAYALDLSESVEFIGENQLEELGVERDGLREVSVANLMARIASIQPVSIDGLLALDVGGFYEASLLLMDHLWDDGDLPIEGPPVVAVPNRDVLIVVSHNDSPGISRLRRVAEQSHYDRDYPISSRLFVRRDGRWERY